MPEIGEFKHGREIGYTQNQKYVWHACKDCGKERWVRLIGESPRSDLCLPCGYIERVGKYTGANATFWKGGRKVLRGYVYLMRKEHPYATSKGYVFEHRLVMEEVLGRYLERHEIVHHLNGITDDNRKENLALVTRANHPLQTLKQLWQKRIRELEAELSQQRMTI